MRTIPATEMLNRSRQVTIASSASKNNIAYSFFIAASCRKSGRRYEAAVYVQCAAADETRIGDGASCRGSECPLSSTHRTTPVGKLSEIAGSSMPMLLLQ